MRIAVLADTHDRLPAALLPKLTRASEIWHLGDVCKPAIIEQLRQIGPRVRVVRGNCDEDDEWPLFSYFVLEGFRIHLTHIPPASGTPAYDLVFHGHTHVPRYEVIDGTTFHNPGCITRPNRGAPASWAWLELEQGQPPKWALEYL